MQFKCDDNQEGRRCFHEKYPFAGVRAVIKRAYHQNLGVFSSSILLLCGSLFMNPNEGWTASEGAKTGSGRPLIIPNNAKITVLPQAGEEPPVESFESYQIRILRNQTHLQAEKIKALREELKEVTHKLHELKPQLFKRGDPEDQAKIANLTYQLGIKEEELVRLLEKNRNSERDIQQTAKKLVELETVKEALASMIEKQRVAKEQMITGFKKHVIGLKNNAAAEKNDLLKKIQAHQKTQEELEAHLGEKNQTIGRLDLIASHQNEQLNKKNINLQQLEAQLQDLYQNLVLLHEISAAHQWSGEETIQDLTATIEWEKGKNQHLQELNEETKWLSDLYDSSQEILKKEIDQLKAELEEQKKISKELEYAKADLELHQYELALLSAAHLDFHSEATDYVHYLVAAIELEQSRTQALENQFLILLGHQDSSHRYAEALEELVSQLDTLLANKQVELAESVEGQNDTIKNLLLHLHDAEQHIEFHQDQKQEIEGQLERWHLNQKSAEEALRIKNGELEEMLADEKWKSNSLMQDLAAYQQALEDRHTLLEERDALLEDRNGHIESLEKRQSDLYEKYNVHLAQLTSELEERTRDLLEKHAAIEQKYLEEKDQRQLHWQLSEQLKTELQEALEALAEADELEESETGSDSEYDLDADQLQNTLSAERERRLALEEEVQYVRSNFIRQHHNMRNLEDILKEANKKISLLEEQSQQQKELLQQFQQAE